MNGDEKSDPTIVAMKPANEPLRRGKERVEPRVGAEGNVRDPHEVRAQDRAASSTGIDRVREVAREKKGERFTTLLHHIDATLLRQAYFWLKRDAAPGVDGMTWDAYGDGLEAGLRDLESRIHLGSYRAQPSLRAYIPKPDGRQRPLGIAALEDKVVQRAVVEVLNAIYEQDFVGFSYGFRPGRGQHDALDALAVGIGSKAVNWILDADIRGFPRVKPKGMLRQHQPRLDDAVRRAPCWRPARVAPHSRVAEGGCGGGRCKTAGDQGHPARGGHLAATGEYLPSLRLRSMDHAMAETACARCDDRGAIRRRHGRWFRAPV